MITTVFIISSILCCVLGVLSGMCQNAYNKLADKDANGNPKKESVTCVAIGSLGGIACIVCSISLILVIFRGLSS
jgi:hypothetical protein